jgi:uncharacterized membrane protein (DUF4010 family)
VFRRTDAPKEELELENPFELGRAIKVTIVFGVVLFVTKVASYYLGDRGLYLASALGGTTDVDAVTVSTANLADSSAVGPVAATTSILIAIAVNTIVKTGLAGGVGSWALGRRVGVIGALVIAAGVVTLAATAALA